MEFSLLHPWLLVGAVGASLPVLIHLIGRRRAPTVRFAAFDFLASVNKRLARRERLRQFLLLLLRTLAVLALVGAVARPMPPRATAATASSRKLALVVDASASMAYEIDGESLLDRAKTRARDVLSNLQPGDMVSLAVADDDVRTPVQNPTLDLSTVRDALAALEKPRGTADLGGAVEKALAAFGDEGTGVSLVVVSDLALNSFEQLQPTTMDPPPQVVLLDAAEREPLAALGNLGIERVELTRAEGLPSERTVRVVVRNFGAQAVERQRLELRVNETITHRAYVSVAPRGMEEKVFTQNFEGPGLYPGDVRLVDPANDGLSADDAAPFVAVVSRGVQILAINGDPRTTPYEDELFFLERALEVVPAGDPPIVVASLTADEFSAGDHDLGGYDAVVLANVGALSPNAVEALGTHVAAGGGLLIALGDRMSFEDANNRYRDLLAHPLRDLALAADPDAGTPPLGIGEMDWDHPVLSGLDAPVEDSLRGSRTRRYFNLDVGAGQAVRTLLRFANGAPALVEARDAGGGRRLLLTTSLDVDMTDLPLRTSFVALMQRLVRYLAGASDVATGFAARAGETLEVPVPTGASAVRLTSPENQILVQEGTGRVRLGPLTTPGIYHAEMRVDSNWAERADLSVAVRPTLAESDYQPISLEDVSRALGGEEGRDSVQVAVTSAGDDSDPFSARGYATWLLLGLGLLFISESLLAARG